MRDMPEREVSNESNTLGSFYLSSVGPNLATVFKKFHNDGI